MTLPLSLPWIGRFRNRLVVSGLALFAAVTAPAPVEAAVFVQDGSLVRMPETGFGGRLGTGSPGAPTLANGGGLTIDLQFGGGLSSSQQAIFLAAKTTWEGLLYDYQPSVISAGRPTPVITATGAAIDGTGGVLGSAGPTGASFLGGYWVTTTGSMTFDSADLDNLEAQGFLDEVLLHEMAHVLGFGSLWNDNNVYTTGSGQYTGANAVNAWKVEFSQPAATFVPVELGGGGGTANGHWDEVDGGGANTPYADGEGRNLRYELMTGWLDPGTYISQTTLESFRDIGFAPVPEPAQGALVVGALALVLVVARRLAMRGATSR